jgi:peptide/nickel transport system permease protein
MRRVIRRLGVYLLALWAAVTINFFLPRLAPGNPAEVVYERLSQHGAVSQATLMALEAEFGINTTQPVWVQYFSYLGNLLHGNLGISTNYYPAPVASIIAQDLPWTLALLTVSVALSFALGTLLGIITAWRRGTLLDSLLSLVLMFFYSLLYPWLALLAVFFLGFSWGWFPFSDGYDVGFVTPGLNVPFILSVVRHAILPALTLIVSTVAGWMLTMRNSMVTTLSEDYILMARAKGLGTGRVMFRYAARNAILPSVTGFAIAVGSVVGGQLLVETVFSYPGIGYALFQAIQSQDYALADGILLLVIVVTVIMNLLVDLFYVLLDPRVRQERSA